MTPASDRILPSAREAFIIALGSLLLMLPAFVLGAGGWDLHCQSLWVKLFSQQFWAGELYPRWLQGMFAGDGSPVFFYYPPLSYYVTALFYFLAPLDAFGYYPIAASAALSAVLSGFAFYIWMRVEKVSAQGALIGSLFYVATPFHLAHNYYFALLFGSVWAYVWLPPLMMFARKIAVGEPYSLPGFAFSLGLLILTSLPLTLLMGPVAVLYSLSYFRRENWMRTASMLVLATLLGFALSAVYLGPALYYRKYTDVDIIWSREIVRTHRFFFETASAKSFLLSVSWPFALFFTLIYTRVPQEKIRARVLAAVSVAALFMMLPLSRYVWDHVPFVETLQMADRFYVIPALAITVFSAAVWPRLKWLTLALLAISFPLTLLVAMDTRTTLESWKVIQPGIYEAYKDNIDQYGSFLNSPDLMQRYGTPEGIREVEQNREQVAVLSGDAKTEVLEWQPREIRIRYRASAPSTLRIRQFYFPGFMVWQDERSAEIRRDDTTGQIVFDIAPGEGTIRVALTALLPETLGKVVSIFSAAVLLLLILVPLRQPKNVKVR